MRVVSLTSLILGLSSVLVFGQASPAPWVTLTLKADRLQDADDVAGAESLRWQALDLAQQQLGKDDPQLVSLSAKLEATLNLEGRAGEAEPAVRRAVEIANGSGDQKLLGIALNALAGAISGEGDRARAEPVLRRSLALLEKSEGLDALDTANAANNLAALYSDTGQYSEAEKSMEVALSYYERHFNSLQSVLAMGLRNMFVILFKQHRLNEAEPYLMRALAIGEKLFPEGRRMSELRFAQGLLETSRGKFQDAAATFKRAIAIQERVLGSQSPELAHTLMAYSDVLRRLHRRDEAHVAQQRSDSILKAFH